MPDLNFTRIVARGGSQQNAFEELCCQIARRTCPVTSTFERFRGAGGDGGVECLGRHPDGQVTGWQAKFVFDTGTLLKQLTKSLQTALSVHKDLTKYVVCFPFDLTGKTAREGTNDTAKLDAWIIDEIKKAADAGRSISIESWPASKIMALLLEHDISGGVRHFFFSDLSLSIDWFKSHIESAVTMAGPRYTPALNVKTPLWDWFLAFDGGAAWSRTLTPVRAECREAIRNLRMHLRRSSGALSPDWPAEDAVAGSDALLSCEAILAKLDALQSKPTEKGFGEISSTLSDLLGRLRGLDVKMSADFDKAHGDGKADSEAFRTFMAEHMVSFPAGNLDAVRDAFNAFEHLNEWLSAPTGYLAFRNVFVLSGAGGSGKTHGICDVGLKRLDDGALTCIVFGHQFSGQPVLWTRLIEALGLPLALSKDALLDALAAAGETSGRPLLFCIDAINETRPRDYWLPWVAPLAAEIEKRGFIKLCVSCRSSFLPACLPTSQAFPVIEHEGFAGLERQACNAFFQHYGLEPPLIPILQPELSNPLYLKLVCETLRLRGLKRLPSGWLGLAPVIRAFIEEKEKAFASETNGSPAAAVISGSLLAIAAAIADSGGVSIPWSAAQVAVNARRPQAANLNVLDWLVRAELLIEDGVGDAFGGEGVLRLAFERFGDFLVAAELISKVPSTNFTAGFKSDARIQKLLDSPTSNPGIIQALAVLLSENPGIELLSLVDASVAESVLEITIRALPWRTPETYSPATRDLVKRGLASNVRTALDAILAISTHKSAIDALWFSKFLGMLDLAKRDAVWSTYLHLSFEDNSIAKRLIDASGDLELCNLDDDTAVRWVTILLWFTAAADRRVKDCATRAVVRICREKPGIIPTLIEEFLYVDDDEVRERLLLCAYGALLNSRATLVLKSVAEHLLRHYQCSPALFENALIRDHIRCIAELAQHLGSLDDKFDPEITTKRNRGGWPLAVPSDEQIAQWRKASRAVDSVVGSALDDDFNHYTIGCLGPWMRKMDKKAIGAWVSGHVAQEMGLAATTVCDNYDENAAYTGGGGRSKPAWAERIGKKYQWIALFRLASRMHDNVTREKSTWDPKLKRTPLILCDERKMDPTLSRVVIPERAPSDCWWIRDTVNLAATKNLDVATWIVKTDDIPELETLLTPTEKNGQRWLPLTQSTTLSEYDRDAAYGTPYRHTWLWIQAFLVPKAKFKKTVASLNGRNFFGGWLPDGGKWLHTFAGEYPWATSCNTEPDYYLGVEEGVRDTALKFMSASNQVVIEWQYDGSLPSSFYLEVPAKPLLPPQEFWWNGTDGFIDTKGRTVFFDPTVRDGGPTTLLADVDALLPQLEEMGVRLFWTMLGKKNLLGDRAGNTPDNCYSQLAYLNEDGTAMVLPRSFFAKESIDTGPRPV